jgi:hypothetical protein
MESSPRYPIASLDVDDIDVLFTVGSYEVVGRVRFTASGKPRYQQRVERKKLQDLPKHCRVSLWRPLPSAPWPFELPDPAVLTREIPKTTLNTASPADEDAPEEGPGWPNPDVRLGRPGEPPESIEEVEARLLRALRIQAKENRSGAKSEVLWLKCLQVEARVVEQHLIASTRGGKQDPFVVGFRPEDYDQFHIVKDGLHARPAPFMPTPRDVSDYEDGIVARWLGMVPRRDRWFFTARAKNPPLSWRQIADEEREYQHVVKGRYRDALKAILRKVR